MARTSCGCGGGGDLTARIDASASSTTACTCGCEANVQAEAPWVRRSAQHRSTRGIERPGRWPLEHLAPVEGPPHLAEPASSGLHVAGACSMVPASRLVRTLRHADLRPRRGEVERALLTIGVNARQRFPPPRQGGDAFDVVDYQPQVACGEVAGITVSPAQIRRLRTTCSINFGLSEDFVDRDGRRLLLKSTVPAAWTPKHSFSDIAKEFLPGWWRSVSKSGVNAIVSNNSWGRARGLITNDVFEDNASLAAKTVASFGHLLDPIGLLPACGFSDSDALAAAMSTVETSFDTNLTPKTLCQPATPPTITVTPSGVVTAAPRPGGVIASGAPPIRFCVRWQQSLALADYFFWWSTRLYSWWVVGGGPAPAVDLFNAMLCARAGLACIVDFAAEYVHEIGHLRTDGHCRENDWRSGAPLGQCQEVMEEMFRRICRAEWGLPLPLALAPRGSSQNLFPLKINESWSDPATLTEGCTATAPPRTTQTLQISARHCGFLTAPHALAISHELSKDCCTYPSLDQRGTLIFNMDASPTTCVENALHDLWLDNGWLP